MGNFFQILVRLRNTEIPIESNFWSEMYVPFILKRKIAYLQNCDSFIIIIITLFTYFINYLTSIILLNFPTLFIVQSF